jgi:DNA modification methylase
MDKYSCEKCAKFFSQKSHYDKHLTRKNPCEIQTDKIKALIDNAIEEKLISNNTKNSITINIPQQMTPVAEEVHKIDCNPTPTDTLKKDTMDYSTKTLAELISLCKERKIKGYSGKKKPELILMMSPQAESVIAPEVKETNEIILTPDEEIKKNTFNIGDNVELLKKVKSETIDMIYLDPPYNTGRNFHYFEDKFADFPKFIEARIEECHRVLKKDGNIIIHVEPRISHYIRVICDKIFGDSNFQNEIVWHSGGNAKNKYQLGRNHDTIIVYSKSSKSKFFPLYKPYSEEYKKGLKMCPHHKKLYSTSAAHNSQPEVSPRLNLRYEWNGNTRQWYLSKEKMKTLHDDNRLEYNEKGIPRIKRYLDEMEGIPVRDTWDDISSIQNGEKTKYATQKPIKLLERVLSLYSAEGDLCMDPFAGSGTLGRACRSMKRDYILFDINPEAKRVFDKEDE